MTKTNNGTPARSHLGKWPAPDMQYGTVRFVYGADREKVSYEEIVYSSMMSIEALVSLLTRKGLITQQEILDELKVIRLRDEKEKN